MAVLRGDGGADDVGGGADRGAVAAEVNAEGQRPGEQAEVDALHRGDVLYDRDHRGREGDVVDESARDRGDPDDDRDHEEEVAAAHVVDELGDEFEDAGLLKTADDDEEAHKEQQGLVVDALDDAGGGALLARDKRREHGEEGCDHADERDREAGLRVRHEKANDEEEDDDVGDKGLVVCDRVLGIGVNRVRVAQSLARFELLTEAEVEVDDRKDEADACDCTRIRQEIKKREAERGADDDVGGISAHRGRAAEVRAEDLCEDHRDGVELQRPRELDRDGREEEDDGDAVDEHRQKRRDRAEADEQGDGVVVDLFGNPQAQPAEDAGLAETLDHDHHAGDEDDRLPVDADGDALGFSVPEGGREDGLDVQRVDDGLAAVQAEAEHNGDHETAADERDVLALDLVHDDHHEHREKDHDCNDLCC